MNTNICSYRIRLINLSDRRWWKHETTSKGSNAGYDCVYTISLTLLVLFGLERWEGVSCQYFQQCKLWSKLTVKNDCNLKGSLISKHFPVSINK